jgi:hypothetical protein
MEMDGGSRVGWDMHELGASWLVFRELVNTPLLRSNDIAGRAPGRVTRVICGIPSEYRSARPRLSRVGWIRRPRSVSLSTRIILT